MDIIIERAEVNDAGKLIDVQNSSFKEDYIRYDGCPAYNEILEKMEETIRKRIVYKILVDDEIIGDIIIRKISNEEYYIRVLSVIPEFQGKDVGTRALEFIFKAYPEVVKWTLITPKTNIRNCCFYEKLGFVKVGEDVRSEKLTLNQYLRKLPR